MNKREVKKAIRAMEAAKQKFHFARVQSVIADREQHESAGEYHKERSKVAEMIASKEVFYRGKIYRKNASGELEIVVAAEIK